MLDIGENSNTSMISKYSRIAAEILPALQQQGAGMVIKPEASAVLATKLIEAMDVDSNDFLVNYDTDEFKEKAAQAIQRQQEEAQAQQALQQRKIEAETSLSEANVMYTGAQTKNTQDDNAKQLAVSIDKHFQEWADLQIKATKEGAELPQHPGYDQIIMLARQILASPPQQSQMGDQQQ